MMFEQTSSAPVGAEAVTPSKSVVIAVALAVTSQLPFWMLGLGLSMTRPLFSLDALLAVCVATRKPRLGVALLGLMWAVDGLQAASLVYHFASPLKFLAGAQYLSLLDVFPLIAWGQVLVFATCVGLALCGSRFLRTHGRGTLKWLVIAIASVVVLDLINGSSKMSGIGPEQLTTRTNVAGSPLMNAALTSWRTANGRGPVPVRFPSQVASYGAIKKFAADHPDSSVLVVIVESMGLPNSGPLQRWLAGSLVTPRIASTWEVVGGSEPFRGSTTYGELRVLCGLIGYYEAIGAADTSSCLPRQAREQGWRAIGLHGFGFNMFDRHDWWPKVGLLPTDVTPTANRKSERGCNDVFIGDCDSVVLDEAVKHADQPRTFAYALTLDTHLPLAHRGAEPDAALSALCEQAAVPSPSCLMVARLGSVLRSLENSLALSRNPPLVVVVGDHAPPFMSNSARASFSSTEVPLWVLRPRRH